MVDERAQRLIDLLGLIPHPEGGYYRETFRSDQALVLGDRKRNASTAIYFLLPAGAFSAFHVIRAADEVWHHYGGDAVEIHTLTPDGEHRTEILGSDVVNDERPQVVVPAGTLQAARVRGASYALCGCTVSPGFDFGDFAMPGAEELIRRFPRHEDVVRRFTRA